MGLFEKTLKNLEKLYSEKENVVSLYLRLFPEDRADGKYLKVYKRLLNEQKSAMEKAGIDYKLLDDDFRAIEDFLSEPENLKDCRGVGIFSCKEKGVFEVVKLPYVYRNRLMVSVVPLIREIATIDEEFAKVAIALLDRKHAKLFLMGLEGIEEVEDFLDPLSTRAHKFHSGGSALKGAEGVMRYSMPSRKGAPNVIQHGVGEYRFHTRLTEEKHRLYKVLNDALMEAWKEYKFEKLVIGSDRDDIKEIEGFLHTYLLERLVGYVRVNPSYVDLEELRNKTLDVLLKKNTQEDREALQRCKDLVGRLSVIGTSQTLKMLQIGNVRELLVPLDYSEQGYLCSQSHIPTLEPVCPIEGEKAIPVADVVNEAIELALEERAKVRVIVDAELQKEMDGLCAILRFSA